jgi:hypothetical protein
MNSLLLNPDRVRKAHADATPELKQLLENLFDAEVFQQVKLPVMERVKTFTDVLAEVQDLGDNEKTLLHYNGVSSRMLGARGILKVTLIAEVLNEGWKPDWTDSSQAKYYPWFDMSSGSSASCHGYYHDNSNSGVGSRLVFKTRELAKYAGTQFQKIYEEFLLLNH